jgi:hypothetical protein
MKPKTLLLLICILSLMPLQLARAEEDPQHPIDDTVNLMYLSDAILTPESEIDDTAYVPGLFSLLARQNLASEADALLARIIHAKKIQRNDLDANCRLLVTQLRAAGEDCEADKVQSYCQTKRSEIDTQIGFYHKVRGDRRKFFTKAWHNIKRNASNFWHRIGPVGRNFLRNLGQDALDIVNSGGNLSGKVIKDLVKHHIKTAVRQRLKEVFYQGVQRLLEGQMAIAAAAGVDICNPDEDENQVAEEVDAEEEQALAPEELQLPDSGTWELSCQTTDPYIQEDFPGLSWKVTISWDTRSFEGFIDGTSIEIDEEFAQERIEWHWKEISSGSITDDGYFWGESVENTTLSVSYGDNPPSVTEYNYDGYWIGTISEDLSLVCFARVGARDWFTTDWVRERGSNALLIDYCEGECRVP